MGDVVGGAVAVDDVVAGNNLFSPYQACKL